MIEILDGRSNEEKRNTERKSGWMIEILDGRSNEEKRNTDGIQPV